MKFAPKYNNQFYVFLYINNAIPIPIILAIFILNCIPNVIEIMLKSSTIGLLSPNSLP